MKGKELKQSLKVKNLTQQEAAEKLGISRQTLSNYLKHEELSEKVKLMVQEKLGIYHAHNSTVSK